MAPVISQGKDSNTQMAIGVHQSDAGHSNDGGIVYSPADFDRFAARVESLIRGNRKDEAIAFIIQKVKRKSKVEEEEFLDSLAGSMLKSAAWSDHLIAITNTKGVISEIDNNMKIMEAQFSFGKKRAGQYLKLLRSVSEKEIEINGNEWNHGLSGVTGDEKARMELMGNYLKQHPQFRFSAKSLDELRLEIYEQQKQSQQELPLQVAKEYLTKILLRPPLISALLDAARKEDGFTVDLLLRMEVAEKPAEANVLANRLGRETDWEYFLNRTDAIAKARKAYEFTVFVLDKGLSASFTESEKADWHAKIDVFLKKYRRGSQKEAASAQTYWNEAISHIAKEEDKKVIECVHYYYKHLPNKPFPPTLDEALGEVLAYYQENLAAPVESNTREYIDTLLNPETMRETEVRIENERSSLSRELKTINAQMTATAQAINSEKNALVKAGHANNFYTQIRNHFRNTHRRIQLLDHLIFLIKSMAVQIAKSRESSNSFDDFKNSYQALLDQRKKIISVFSTLVGRAELAVSMLSKSNAHKETVDDWNQLKGNVEDFSKSFSQQQLVLEQTIPDSIHALEKFKRSSIGFLSLVPHYQPMTTSIAADVSTSSSSSGSSSDAEEEVIDDMPQIYTQKAGMNCLWVSFLNGLDKKTHDLLRNKPVDLTEAGWQEFLVKTTHTALSAVKKDWKTQGITKTELKLAIDNPSILATTDMDVPYLVSKLSKLVNWMDRFDPEPIDKMTQSHFSEFEEVVKNGAELQDLYVRLDDINNVHGLNFQHIDLGNLDIGSDTYLDQFIDADRGENIAMITMPGAKEELMQEETLQTRPGTAVEETTVNSMKHFTTQRWINNLGYEFDGLGKGTKKPVIVAERYRGQTLLGCMIKMPGDEGPALHTDPLLRYRDLSVIWKQTISSLVEASNGQVSFWELFNATKAAQQPGDHVPDSIMEGKLPNAVMLTGVLNRFGKKEEVAKLHPRTFGFESSPTGAINEDFIKANINSLMAQANTGRKDGKKSMIILPVSPYCAELINDRLHFSEHVDGYGKVAKNITIDQFIKESIQDLQARRKAANGNGKLLQDIPSMNDIRLIQLNGTPQKRMMGETNPERDDPLIFPIHAESFRSCFETVTGMKLQDASLMDLMSKHLGTKEFTADLWNAAFDHNRESPVMNEASCVSRDAPMPIVNHDTKFGLVRSTELQLLQKDIRSGKLSSVILTLPAPYGVVVIEKGHANEVVVHCKQFGTRTLEEFAHDLINDQSKKNVSERIAVPIKCSVLEIKGLNKPQETITIGHQSGTSRSHGM